MATPNDVLQVLAGAGIACESWQTGGNCGAIGILTGREYDDPYILITPDGGPYSYGSEGHDVGEVWRVALYLTGDDDGVWIDSDLVMDGDATLHVSDIIPAVNGLLAWN
jgi:hypothetical protein